MSFLHPENLAWLLLAAPLVLLYLGTLYGARREVAAHFLWRRALARRRFWSRWRRPVSLLAVLGLLVLLVAALVEPYLRAEREQARSLVLVFDVSASMRAADVPPSRLDEARSVARAMIAGLGRHERMAILSAGALVSIEQPWTSDRDALLAAVDAIRPTDAARHPTPPVRLPALETDRSDRQAASCTLEEAVALARRMLAGAPHPWLVLLTDRAEAWVHQPAAETADGIRLLVFGSSGDNVGLTRLAARRRAAAPHLLELLVAGTNYGDAAIERVLSLRLDGGPQQSVPLRLEAGASFERRLAWEAGGGGSLVAVLEGEDALPADDRAEMRVPPAEPLHVVLVGAASEEVAAALRALPGVSLEFRQHAEPLPQSPAVCVFYRTAPQSLPDCAALVVDPQQDSDVWRLRPAGTSADSAPWAPPHVRRVLLGDLRLDEALIERPIDLVFDQPVQTVAASAAGVPVYSLLSGNGRPPLLVLHAGLPQSDLPLRGDVPRLIAAAIRFLGKQEDAVVSARRTSELVEIDAAAPTRCLIDPHGDALPLPAGLRLAGPLDQAGVWKVATGAPGAAVAPSDAPNAPQKIASNAILVELPANLLDAEEGAIKPRGTSTSENLAAAGPGRGPLLWLWAAVAALIVNLIHWTLVQTRFLE